MKWSLLGRRCHRALSVCIRFSPCWQNDMTEALLAPSPPPLPHSPTATLHATYKWLLTVKVKFHLYSSHLHLPSTDHAAPAALLSWLACCLQPTEKKTGATSDRSSTSASCLLRVWKETFQGGYRKVCVTLHSPDLELWPTTYSLLIIALCCLVTYRHACEPPAMYNSREISVFDEEKACAAEVVL